MVVGLEHSKKILADLADLLLEGISVAQHGVGIGAIRQIMALVADMKDLLIEAPLAFPELEKMDAAEAQELAKAAYELFKNIVTSFHK